MVSDPNITIPEEARQAAFNAAVAFYGIHPTTVRDADTADVVDATLAAAAPLIVAEWAERVSRDYMPPDEVDDYDQAEEYERFGVQSMCILLRNLAAELRGRVGSLTHKEGEQP